MLNSQPGCGTISLNTEFVRLELLPLQVATLSLLVTESVSRTVWNLSVGSCRLRDAEDVALSFEPPHLWGKNLRPGS